MKGIAAMRNRVGQENKLRVVHNLLDDRNPVEDIHGQDSVAGKLLEDVSESGIAGNPSRNARPTSPTTPRAKSYYPSLQLQTYNFQPIIKFLSNVGMLKKVLIP